jgi:hypothetical protein
MLVARGVPLLLVVLAFDRRIQHVEKIVLVRFPLRVRISRLDQLRLGLHRGCVRKRFTQRDHVGYEAPCGARQSRVVAPSGELKVFAAPYVRFAVQAPVRGAASPGSSFPGCGVVGVVAVPAWTRPPARNTRRWTRPSRSTTVSAWFRCRLPSGNRRTTWMQLPGPIVRG